MLDGSGYWTAVASVAALIAVFFSYRSNRIAKQSLKLSEKTAGAREPQIVPYLIDGFVRPIASGEKRVYAFSVSLSNRADTDNALAAIELKVNYKRRDGTRGHLLLPHDTQLLDELGLERVSSLNAPQTISAHNTVAGWVMFELYDTHIGDVDVEGYEIRFRDSHGIECKLEPIILREIVDEPSVA